MAKAPVFRVTSGLNNAEEPHRLEYGEDGGCPLSEAVNVVVSNGGGLRRRYPKRLVHDKLAHSFWSHGDYAFFCSEGKLYRMLEDETLLTVSPSVGGAEMSYAEFMGKIFCTNGMFRGVIDGPMLYPWTESVPSSRPDSDTRQLGFPSVFSRIFTHAGRMCLVDADKVWVGEPFNPGCYDLGSGPFSLGSSVVDFASVKNGIYVSNEEGVYFLAGSSKSDFMPRLVHDEPIVRGTCLSTPAHALRLSNFGNGLAAVWVSRSGVFVGMNNGEIVNVSDSRLRLPVATRGQACIYDGYYIFSLEVT